MLETLEVVLERLADPGPLINPESEDTDPAPFSDPPTPFLVVPMAAPPPPTPPLPPPPPPVECRQKKTLMILQTAEI